MTALLIIAALVVAMLGVVSLSQATAGVGGIAFACLLMIWARIVQAHEQERERKRAAMPSPLPEPAAPPRSPELVAADNRKFLLGLAVVVGGLVIASLAQSYIAPWFSSRPAELHSGRNAFTACAERVASTRKGSEGVVEPYRSDAVEDRGDGRYLVSAAVGVGTETSALFRCDVEWVTGSTYDVKDIGFSPR